MLIQILLEKNIKTSKLCDIIKLYPQLLINIKVQDDKKYDFETNAKISEEIQNINKKIKSDGRLIIRASGTEPLIRIMIEGKDLKQIKTYAETLEKLIKDELG